METPAPPAAADPSQELDMDAALRDFEARCDKSDPEQLALLEAMREHTRRLHQARGDWNKPNTRRNWNSARPPAKAKPPTSIESYKEYKQHLAKEAQWQQRQQQRRGPLLALTEAAEGQVQLQGGR